jgi:mRNA interferase RelE/StbE
LFIPGGLSRIFRSLSNLLKFVSAKQLLRFEPDPLSHATGLTNTDLGTYRFRIGDYRIIFDLDGDEIVVLRVGHRRDIYKG